MDEFVGGDRKRRRGQCLKGVGEYVPGGDDKGVVWARVVWGDSEWLRYCTVDRLRYCTTGTARLDLELVMGSKNREAATMLQPHSTST
jgi:hypothetical protein